MHDRWRKQVDFYVVYIKEAHPEDGWVLEMNRAQGIAVKDATSSVERAHVAESCALRLKIRMPVLLDALDNQVARTYGGWPDRLYLIDKGGRIAFRGGEGPAGFKPDELEQAIERELGVGPPDTAPKR